MAKLIYSAIASLDGYVEDKSGNFEWAAPDDEVHAFVNDLERPIGTYLYGRRMYETMVYWETVSISGDQPAAPRDFVEIWRAAEKIVYSRTLQTLSSARTRIDAFSIRRRSSSSRSPRPATSRLAVRSSLARPSPRAWSTNATCSSARLWSGAESAHCRMTSASSSSPWTSTASEAVSFTSATGYASDQHVERTNSWPNAFIRLKRCYELL